MKRGINTETIRKLEEFCADLYEGQYYGNDRETMLKHYRYMSDVREDMRQQAEPIGGRFIDAGDVNAVLRALDFLHNSIMRRGAEFDEDKIEEELRKLMEYLRQAVV